MRYDYMVCPVRDLSTNAFSAPSCVPNQVFTFRHLPLPREITVTLKNLVSSDNVWWASLLYSTDLCSVSVHIIDWSERYDYPLGTFPAPRDCLGRLRFARCTVRRFLRERLQTCFQYQGLWRQHPRTWRHDRSHGLPIPHGSLHFRLLRFTCARFANHNSFGTCDCGQLFVNGSASRVAARRSQGAQPERNPCRSASQVKRDLEQGIQYTAILPPLAETGRAHNGDSQ